MVVVIQKQQYCYRLSLWWWYMMMTLQQQHRLVVDASSKRPVHGPEQQQYQQQHQQQYQHQHSPRQLQENNQVPYNVVLTMSLQYLNNTVATFIESKDTSNDIISHLCLSINQQVHLLALFFTLSVNQNCVFVCVCV